MLKTPSCSSFGTCNEAFSHKMLAIITGLIIVYFDTEQITNSGRV